MPVPQLVMVVSEIRPTAPLVALTPLAQSEIFELLTVNCIWPAPVCSSRTPSFRQLRMDVLRMLTATDPAVLTWMPWPKPADAERNESMTEFSTWTDKAERTRMPVVPGLLEGAPLMLSPSRRTVLRRSAASVMLMVMPGTPEERIEP